ncbi:MAG: hypothetical protein AVDCRST_MAG26-2043 [uncultured Chloroflexia bacterium]|uniref:Uncharacterized protein n=1 Tax=uncultured Chloroflexia bacterium TaxID=1672391 RepID=A0A6J4IJZ3_9CHLR|nr:MAG: hypothetical protein AVDCRST_MAG26-2043 [uncultured Chloroflexia bacterium]
MSTAIVDERRWLSYARLVARVGRGLYDTKFRQAPQLETSAEKRERMFLNMSS